MLVLALISGIVFDSEFETAQSSGKANAFTNLERSVLYLQYGNIW